jgi:hypothetical protein
MRRGRAGFRLSISPAKLSASLQRSAIASEFTYSKFRSHSGRTVCSDGAPTATNGGLKVGLPMSFGLAASLISRLITAGEYAIDAILPSGLIFAGSWNPSGPTGLGSPSFCPVIHHRPLACNRIGAAN